MENEKCRICGVIMAKKWSDDICFHCNWHLGDGYSEEEIKEIIKKNKGK